MRGRRIVLWEADAGGAVTTITQCRPSARQNEGELDEGEVAQVELLWRKALRLGERFSAGYHVRMPGGDRRNFSAQAVPIFDQRDEVLRWQGHVTEVQGVLDSGTRYISEASAVMSSSLNRATIVNRLIETSLVSFCDFCALYTFADDGSLRLEGSAHRRSGDTLSTHLIAGNVNEAAETRQALLFHRRAGGHQPRCVP